MTEEWYNPNAVDTDGDGLVQDGTAFQRPAKRSQAGKGEETVFEAPELVAEEPAVEPAAEPAAEPVQVAEVAAVEEPPAAEPEFAPAPEPEPEPVQVVAEPPAAVAPVERVVDADAVDVVLAALTYPGVNKNSASVRRVQYQLYHAGYADVTADQDGHYAEGTFNAVSKFQATQGLDVTGILDRTTLEKLFANQPGVRIVL